MIQAGYETSVVAVDCPVEEALKRIQYRANHNPTPEDNLWDSMPRIDLPDKFDYQCVDFAALCCEYEKRKVSTISWPLGSPEKKPDKRKVKRVETSPEKQSSSITTLYLDDLSDL